MQVRRAAALVSAQQRARPRRCIGSHGSDVIPLHMITWPQDTPAHQDTPDAQTQPMAQSGPSAECRRWQCDGHLHHEQEQQPPLPVTVAQAVPVGQPMQSTVQVVVVSCLMCSLRPILSLVDQCYPVDKGYSCH